MAEISEAIAMIKKAESDAEQLILDSESKSVDMVNESKINAENIINEAKKAAEEDIEFGPKNFGATEEEAKNTVFDAEDKAKKEAQSIAKDGEANVVSLKDKAMANVDEAASIIVKNVL